MFDTFMIFSCCVNFYSLSTFNEIINLHDNKLNSHKLSMKTEKNRVHISYHMYKAGLYSNYPIINGF